jgi:aminoglycoside phosphotransferase (APT) family kinase protein
MYIEKELNGESIKNTTLSEEEKNIIIQKAGKDLAKLNSIEVKGVGWIEGTKNNQLYSKGKDYDDFIIRNIRNMLNKFIEIKILSNEQADKITEYIQSNKEFIDIKDNSYLAHGDFCIEHIYHANGKYSGIIDFGDIRGTSKYHDLAHFYTYNRKYFKSLVEGYNSIYKLTTDCIDKVKIEAVIFAVGKLWWVSQNKLHKIENHPALDLFEEIVY